MNKSIIFIALILVLALTGGAFLYWSTPATDQPAGETSGETPQNETGGTSAESEHSKPSATSPSSSPVPPSYSGSGQTGRLLFTITDSTAPNDDASSIFLTISSLTARNEKATWVPISARKHTYDLLQLKRDGKQELVFDTTIPMGTYDQIALTIDSVTMITNGVAKNAKLPTKTLYIPLSIPLRVNQTAALTINFVAGKSFHTTDTGLLVYAPVVDVHVLGEIQLVQTSGSKVEFFNGLPKFAGSYGMNEIGIMQKDSFGIDSLSRIELVQDIFVLIPQSLNRSLFTIAPNDAITTALTGGHVAKVLAVYAELLDKKPVWRVKGTAANGTIVSVYINASTGSVEKVQ